MDVPKKNFKFLNFTFKKKQLCYVNQSHQTPETKIKALETDLKTLKEKVEELQAQLQEHVSLDEAKLQCEKLMLRIAKEWSQRQAAELEELQAAPPQGKTYYKDRMDDLSLQIEETLKKHMQFNEFTKQIELDMKIEKLEKTITSLKKEKDLSKKVIRKKNLKISHLMKDNTKLQEDLTKEKDKNTVLLGNLNETEDILHDVKEDLRASEPELNDTRERLNKTLRENADLGETNSDLMDKVRRCESDLIQEPEKNKNLTTDVMPFKGNLQVCMDLTSQPQTFVSKVLDVKRNHTDTESIVQVNGNNEIGLRLAFAAKDQLIDSNSRCHQNSSRAEKLCQEQIFQIEVQSNQDQSSLIRQVHDMTVELDHVKTQLPETTRLPELARKPWQQKVKSWLKKKLFSRNKVAPIDAEEPPSRLPGDHTVHRRADNTSSSKPRPDTEDGIIHVQPFVESDLQIVDV